MREIRIYLLVLVGVAVGDRWANWYHSPLHWLTELAFAVVWCAIWIASSSLRQKPPRHISRLEQRAYDAIPGRTEEERSAAVHAMIDRLKTHTNDDGLDDRRATETDN